MGQWIEVITERFKEEKPSYLDDPNTTLYHRDLILHKPFLRKIYLDWYKSLLDVIDDLPDGHIVELGSGGGFLKDVYPQVLTSDVLALSHCDFTCPAHQLPFRDGSVAGLFMVDVLHHIPNVREFFAEAERVLMPGGQIVMIEPANTFFSRFIYQNFHHEEFDPEVKDWHFNSSGALSGANGALPWIVFERDRDEFHERFTDLNIEQIQRHTPFRYLLSGGLSYRFPIPSFLHGLVKWGEVMLEPFSKHIAMFQTISVVKKGEFLRKPIERKPVLPENYGLFRKIAFIYYSAGANLFKYIGKQHWVTWPFLFVFAILVYPWLMLTGLLFRGLFVVDIVGFWIAKKRVQLLDKMREYERELESSPENFEKNPLKIAALMPVASLTAVIPVVGGGIAAVTANFFDDLNRGAFGELRAMVKNVFSANLRMVQHKPDLTEREKRIAYTNIVLFSFVGLGVAILSVFDLLSDFIGHSRKLMLGYLHNRSYGICAGFFGFLLNPYLLLLLSPVIILILVSPYLGAF